MEVRVSRSEADLRDMKVSAARLETTTVEIETMLAPPRNASRHQCRPAEKSGTAHLSGMPLAHSLNVGHRGGSALSQ